MLRPCRGRIVGYNEQTPEEKGGMSNSLVRIRLRRAGAKKRPMYRVVAADIRAPRDGAFLEILGHYDPMTDPATIVLDRDKVLKWLGRGAQPSEAAAKLLRKSGILEQPGPSAMGQEESSDRESMDADPGTA